MKAAQAIVAYGLPVETTTSTWDISRTSVDIRAETDATSAATAATSAAASTADQDFFSESSVVDDCGFLNSFTGSFGASSLHTRGPQDSIGALLHPNGCTPCAFYCFKKSGCNKGKDCLYCHMTHISKQRAHRTQWKEEQRQKRRARRKFDQNPVFEAITDNVSKFQSHGSPTAFYPQAEWQKLLQQQQQQLQQQQQQQPQPQKQALVKVVAPCFAVDAVLSKQHSALYLGTGPTSKKGPASLVGAPGTMMCPQFPSSKTDKGYLEAKKLLPRPKFSVEEKPAVYESIQMPCTDDLPESKQSMGFQHDEPCWLEYCHVSVARLRL